MAGVELPSCAIRRQLAEEFALAARLYAEAVVLFTRPPVTVPGCDYQRLRAAVEQALERSQSVGRAYHEHIASHGCEDPMVRIKIAAETRRQQSRTTGPEEADEAEDIEEAENA